MSNEIYEIYCVLNGVLELQRNAMRPRMLS